jgi:uncharacterized protein
MSAHTDHSQQEAIDFLADPASWTGVDRVERLETHGNLVFLAGAEAWKIKRAVRFPYMDFSTLEKRHAACVREVEINRRFAPELYLGCVAISRAPSGALAFGGDGDVVEWAVRMRRFEQADLLSSVAAKGEIARDLAARLGDVVHACHERAEPAVAPSGARLIGEVAAGVCEALANSGAFDSGACRRLQHDLGGSLQRCAAVLDARARQGFVRRCHGDLHLANIVLWQGQPMLYDAIEFDDAIATVDVLYDLAFLLMDLDASGQRPAANVVLNRYLWRSRRDLDLQGLLAMPLFLALRAAVRAMVTVQRAAQESEDARRRDIARANRYFAAALGYLERTRPRLVAVGGLSGTGKTTLAGALAPRVGCAPGAVHFRSDLERKALAGVGELERLPDSAYGPEARAQVYRALEQRARVALAAGHSVIVDAVFNGEDDRAAIEAVAAELKVPFTGIWLEADPAKLVARVEARHNDASDATPVTVRGQLESGAGMISPAWTRVEAGDAAGDTLQRAAAALGLGNPQT